MLQLVLFAAALGWFTSSQSSTYSDQSNECRHRVPLLKAPLKPTCIELSIPDEELCGGESFDLRLESPLRVMIKLYALRVSGKTNLVQGADYGYLQDAADVKKLLKSLQEAAAGGLFWEASIPASNGKKYKCTIWPNNTSPWLAGNVIFYPLPPAEGITALGLSITPTVCESGSQVELALDGSSSFLDQNRYDQPYQRFASHSRVLVPDGKAVVLFGPSCPDSTVSAFPILADLPLIGDLYKFSCVEPGQVLVIAAIQMVDECTASSPEFQQEWAAMWR